MLGTKDGASDDGEKEIQGGKPRQSEPGVLLVMLKGQQGESERFPKENALGASRSQMRTLGCMTDVFFADFSPSSLKTQRTRRLERVKLRTSKRQLHAKKKRTSKENGRTSQKIDESKKERKKVGRSFSFQ